MGCVTVPFGCHTSELALEVVDAVARRDAPRLLELTDPEVEWQSFLADLGEGGVYRGHDGMRRYVNDVEDALDVIQLHGVDRDTMRRMAKFRDGRVILLRAFRDPEQAFEAVGLSE